MKKTDNSIKACVLNYVWMVLQRIMPSKAYLKLKYLVVFKRKLNLDNPVTFTEKLQWLKLYDYRKEYTLYVDKVLVKDYVASVIGSDYVIPTLGVWSAGQDIDFENLPDSFILKCNHNSGEVVICRNKSELDVGNARKVMARLLKDNYYLVGRETPYRYVRRRIFAEELLEMPDGKELLDYKFFCFDGKPEFLKINFDKDSVFSANYYDLNMNLLPFGEVWPAPDPTRKFEKPENFDKMIEIASRLSTGIPFARIDLYNVGGRIYFGEITLYPTSGFGPFNDYDWDVRLGNMIQLPQKH